MDYISLVQVLDSQSDLECKALCNLGGKYVVVIQFLNVRCQTGTHEPGDNAEVQTIGTLVIEVVKHLQDMLIPSLVLIKVVP